MKPLVLQITGTSGSGKSHLMRSFLDYARKHLDVEEVSIEGRSTPIGYLIRPSYKDPIFVPGAYTSPTGGCDTIRDVSQVYGVIKDQLERGRRLAYEGLFCMNMTRGPQLAEELGKKFLVLQLTTPLATCMASINARRAERGAGELANKHNTNDNYRRATNYCASMREAGARVQRITRDEGLDVMLEAFAIPFLTPDKQIS